MRLAWLCSGSCNGDSRGLELLDKDSALRGVSCESVKTAHHPNGSRGLADGVAQARGCGAIAVSASCTQLSVVLIVGDDVAMLKAIGGAAVDLRLKCVDLAQRLELGAPGVERCSCGSFVVILSSDHVCLLYIVLLIGLAERGTAPDECRVVADSASQFGRSSCKTLRSLVRALPLAGLLLVFRVPSLLTPCSSDMQHHAAAFY